MMRLEKVFYLTNPTTKDLENFIDMYVFKYILILLARCKVFYEGRAKSQLEEGDRVIIIKPDGAFLIHKDKKREPVNWQPSGSSIIWEVEDNFFILKSIRRKPKEELKVVISEVYHACAFNCEDYEEINLRGSESEMAEMIFRNPDLIEEGFKPISREYQIPTGIVDILGKDKENKWVILELKRRRADLQAVSQLKRYVEYFKNKYGEDKVRGILVSPSLTTGAEKLLKEENLEFKRLNPPKGSKRDLKHNIKTKKTTVLDEWL
ncbi:conserved hypothetical protein [Methanocaldococcus jannaschii DSM 2661]|uniref:Endonuclease NucS n=2 Tax=Methanocaldococcus jannaschii TaxID=2190 RepID=NUCS_METJA|nr:RecName: Full=Endonuclease NucS [Methanocaldococcus jannaschii DSM 2661]AAB98210.1 conserved hypothetical protein [Methanocaldococcus jannaschii DSM 2661]